MKAFTQVARFSVVSLGLAAVLAGCGGPDNESGALKNTDGTTTQVIPASGGGMSAEEYNKKSAGSQESLQQKGYPGANKKK